MSTNLQTRLDHLTDAVTLNPPAAGMTLGVTSELVRGCEVDVRVGEHSIGVDESADLGGRGAAPSSVEYALLALGACWATTCRIWSVKHGVRLDKVTVNVTGALDIRGMLGLADEVPPGCTQVNVAVTLWGPEAPEDYAALARAVDAHCRVLDMFATPTPVTSTLTVA
jgi:putative redox protein